MIQNRERHETCASHSCLSSDKETQEIQTAVARELLTYLGHLPQKLHRNELEAGELALMLGNCLLWIHHKLEPETPEVEQGLDQTPQSIFALSKQFQIIGRQKLDQKTRNSAIGVDQYAGILCLINEQNKRFESLEQKLQNLINLHFQPGGAK